MSHLLTRLRAKRGEEGFTLVELLVVVVIIGILIAIAIPVYLNYTKSAKDKSAQSDLRNAISVIETCAADNNNTYPGTMTGASNGSDGTFGNDCAQTVKTSAGTTMFYTKKSTGSGYTINDYNAGGKQYTYCYDSTVGGSVKQSAAATGTPAALATCPPTS